MDAFNAEQMVFKYAQTDGWILLRQECIFKKILEIDNLITPRVALVYGKHN